MTEPLAAKKESLVVGVAADIADFFRMESAGGVVLMFAAAVAIILANSPLSGYYSLIVSTPVEVRIGGLEIAKPLLLWINDGLMALFFLLVGLELKREMLEGELSEPQNIVLPAIGAIGGMLIPALIYLWFNRADSLAMQGWAIPAATDIAFALGILSLLGSRVPISAKIFLTSLAIFDDLGAILIIAFFYTANISLMALIIVALCIPLLSLLNHYAVESKSIYILIGVIMWVAMLKSGVHATLTGVILAAFVPMRSQKNPQHSPLKEMEHDLHTLVAFVVLPVFAFANAGISFSGVGFDQLLHGVPAGIALGLFVGKQIGVFGLCFLAVRSGFCELPKNMNWPVLYGISLLCGVGFTMSLFIGGLAFEATGVDLIFDERLGIILGSLVSGVLGYLVLRMVLPKGTEPEDEAQIG